MAADVIIDPVNGQIYWNDSAGIGTESISIKGDAQNAISFIGYGSAFSPGSTPSGATTRVTFNDSVTNTLVPGTNGNELGSATLRWNTYATNVNLSGTLVVSDSTISSSLLTGSVKFNGGIAISGNASIGQSLLLYGAGTAYTSYTGFKAGSAITSTLYTLPINYPGSGTSVLQSDTSGTLTWVPMSASSSGGTVSSATQYQIAGYYSGTGASVSGSSTFINNTATGQVQITHTTASFGTSTGALQVAGGVGISGRLSFNQASFGTTGISSNPTMAMIGQTGDPIYLSVLEDNSISFEGSQGQLFSISPNLTTGYIWAVNDISGVPLLRASAGGTVYIAEFGAYLGIGQTNPTYKLDLKGSFGLASSNDALYNFIFSNSAASGSNNFQIRSANSILFYNSGNTFYTGFKSSASANKLYVLPATDGSSGQFLQTDGNQNLTWATATGGGGGSGATGVNPGGQYQIGYYASTGSSIDGSSTFTNNTSTGVVAIGHATASTNIGNGALTVSGGVGIGGSLYVGGTGSSISGVRIASGAITVGAWNATVVGTQYGGTGQNLSGSSGILTISSGTVSASTTSSAIASALSDETGSGALVFATSPALVTPDIGAATGTSLYLSAVSPSTSTTTGALRVPGGVGIGLSVSIGGRLQIFNGSNYSAFLFAGTSNTTYTLPDTSPATGSSVLQSTSQGVMSWVPMVSGGSGSVNSGTATFAAYYASTSTAISENANLQFTGTGLSVGGNVQSTSTLTGSLQVRGGFAITGNAFIGGTVYVPSTTASNYSNLLVSNNTATTSTTSGALVVAGGLGLAGNAFIGGTAYIPSSTASNISNLLISNNTATTSTTSGALVVNGGLGLGGNAFIGGTIYAPSTSTFSISGINFGNGIVTTGTWSGSTITAYYGGTGLQGPSATGDIIVANTPTTWSRYSVSSNSGYVLTSNGANAAPTWQAVPPAAASSVAAIATTSNASFFITSVSGANVSGVGLSTVTSFVVNPFTGLISLSGLAVTSLTASTSTTTGALTVAGGFGLAGNAFIGGTAYIPSSTASNISNLLVSNNTATTSTTSGALVVAGGLGLGGNAFIGGTAYIPSATASNISNLLVSNNSATTSTTSGALVVNGGLGLGGNAFIGGTVYVPSATASNYSNLLVSNTTATTSTTSGALVVNGGAAVGQSLSVGGSLNVFNGANYSGFRFAGSANTTYILPPRTPTGTGSSYLSSGIDGVMAWVAAPTGGSATPGGSNKQIQFNNSNAFGGASGFEYAAGGIAVTVGIFAPSGTGYTAGLWINAINGTTTRVGIGLSNPAYELEILGEISATNKSFVIDHPTKEGMKLRYGSLEGPENGVYVRGELKNSNIIEVPDHWIGLVHLDSYTVHLTPIGRYAQLFVEKIENYNVFISDANMNPIHCYYSVWAERKDIPKLITEYEAQ